MNAIRNVFFIVQAEKSRAFLWALIFCALAIILRVPFLASEPPAMDEPFTLYWAQKDVSEIMQLSFNENNPPAHFILLHVWMKLFGTSAFSWRFPSLLFSLILIVGAVFSIARKSLPQAVIIGLLFLLSNQHIYFSMEARAYALLALLTWIAFVVSESNRKNKYVELAFVCALLIYTHYLSVWIIAAVYAGFLIDGNIQVRWKKIFAFTTLLLVLVLPIVVPAVTRIRHMSQTGTWVEKPVLTQIYGHINLMWNSPVLTVLFIVSIIYFLYQKRSRIFSGIREVHLLRPLLWFLIIYGGLFIQSFLFQPVFIPRYLFFSSVPLFIFFSGFILHVFHSGRVRWILAVLVLVCLLPGIELKPSFNRDMRLLVSETEAMRGDSAALIICPAHASLSYSVNAYPDDFFSGMDEHQLNAKYSIFPVNSFAEIPDSLLHCKRLVYLDAAAEFTLPNNAIVESLTRHFRLTADKQVPQIYRIILAERAP